MHNNEIEDEFAPLDLVYVYLWEKAFSCICCSCDKIIMEVHIYFYVIRHSVSCSIIRLLTNHGKTNCQKYLKRIINKVHNRNHNLMHNKELTSATILRTIIHKDYTRFNLVTLKTYYFYQFL